MSDVEDQEVVDNLEAEPATQFEALVNLDEVEVDSGESEEDCVYKKRCRVYRFLTDSKSWVERGRGDIKLLRRKDTGTYRIVLRQELTLKLRVNHMINSVELKANQGSDRAWTWSAADYSDDNPNDEVTTFAIRLDSSESAMEFKKFYEEGQAANRKAEANKKEAPAPAPAAAAEE